MAANWHDGFTLRSVWEPSGDSGRYKLIVTNEIDSDVANIKLCFSGPGRIGKDATITNGRVVTRLSNYTEIMPAAPMVLAPGASWEIGIDKLQFPLRHWTDGAVTGFVVFGDVPQVATLIGASIIIAAGIYIFLREQALGREESAVNPPV